MHYPIPTLLIDKDKVLSNIRTMADRAAHHGVRLSPHLKSHQSKDIASWYRQFAVNSITVSSLKMAQYFATDGWDDITVAFPANPLELLAKKELVAETTLTVLINSPEVVKRLDRGLASNLRFYIEIDTGYPRTGVSPENTGRIKEIIELASKSDLLDWRGFYSHPGQSYDARGVDEIRVVHDSALMLLRKLKDEFSSGSFTLEVSVGDTPCCSTATHFNGVDEIRPGNFAFFDLDQVQIGSCREEEISLCMACPIVEMHPERNEVIIHGGAVHFSKDHLQENGNTIFGRYVPLEASGWGSTVDGNYLRSVSQEHGVLQTTPEVFERLQIGDSVGILPAHSCLCADLMGAYTTLDGEQLNHLRQSE